MSAPPLGTRLAGSTARDVSLPAADRAPPEPVKIEIVSTERPGLFTAHLADAEGFVLAANSPRPFADAAHRLLALGADPDHTAVMVFRGHPLRSARLGDVAEWARR